MVGWQEGQSAYKKISTSNLRRLSYETFGGPDKLEWSAENGQLNKDQMNFIIIVITVSLFSS